MWAKGAAVGNASRCPWPRLVRRRRIVHMSIAGRGRSARPRAVSEFASRAEITFPRARASPF